MNLKVNLTIGTKTIDITSFIPVGTLEIIKNRTEKEIGDYVASDIDITLIDKDFSFEGKNFKQIFTEFPCNLQDYYPIEIYLDERLIFSGYLVRETVEFENEYIIKASCISIISYLDTIPLSEIFSGVLNISGNYISILEQIKNYLRRLNIDFSYDIGSVEIETKGRWNWVRQYLFEKTNFRPSEIVPIYFQREGKTYFGIVAINGYLYYLVYKDLDFFLERFTLTHSGIEIGTDSNRVVRIFRGRNENTRNLYYFAVGKFYNNWEQVGLERIYQFKFTNHFEPTDIMLFFEDPNVSITKPESINIADYYHTYQNKYVDVFGKARMTKEATENLKYYFDLLEIDGDRLIWRQKCEIDDEPYGVAYHSRWAISGSSRAYIWAYGLTTPLKFDGIDRTIFIGGYYEIGGDVIFIFKNAKLIRPIGMGAWLIIPFKEDEEVLAAKDHLGLFRKGDEIYVWNFYTNEKFYDYPLPRGMSNIPPGTFYEQIGNEIRERPIVIFEDEIENFNIYNIWLVISKIIPFIHEYELKDTSLRAFLSEIAKSFFCYLCLQGIQQRNFMIRRDIYFDRYCPPQRTIKKEEIIEHPMIEIRKWDGIEIKAMDETIRKGATGFNKKYFSYPSAKYLTPAWAEWISETFYQLYCSNEFKTYELSVLYDKRNPIGLLFAYNFNLFNKNFRGLVCEVNYRRSDNLLHLIVEELPMIPQQRVPEEQVIIVSELVAVGTSLWELDLDEPDSITLKEEITSGAGLWDYDEVNDEVMPALLVKKDIFWELDEENNLVPK
jgi:hypothetical protein